MSRWDVMSERLGLSKRQPEPLEGTNMSLWNSQIPDWWAANINGSASWMMGTELLSERVWVANRCIQLNAQQIATMPIRLHGEPEPAWVSNPDPHWFPNGIADAVFAMVASLYGWGFSCQYVTDYYSDGFPRTWTVLDPANTHIKLQDGSRQYKYGEEILDPRRVVQIDRDPGALKVQGTSALKSYAQNAWGLLAAGNQSMTVNQGGNPQFFLKSERKLNKQQAEDIQAQWMNAATSRNGAPPIVPPELTPTAMSFDPSDLALLETQEFNARAIATAFGVPAMLLNMPVTGGLTYQNPAALGEMWWRFELRTLATRIANAWSAQLLPRGQWVSFDAADTFMPLTEMSEEDDTQASQTAKATPAQQPRLTAVGGDSP